LQESSKNNILFSQAAVNTPDLHHKENNPEREV